MGEHQVKYSKRAERCTDGRLGRWRRPRYTLGRTGIRLGNVGLRTRCGRLGRDCVCHRLLPTDWWRVNGISYGDSQHHRLCTELRDYAVVYRYGFAELFHYGRVRLRCLYGDLLTVYVEGQKPAKVLREDIRTLC